MTTQEQVARSKEEEIDKRPELVQGREMGRRYGSLWHVHSRALLTARENIQSSREG